MSALGKHVPSFVSGLVGAVVGVSMLGGAAYAANGGSFLLGKSNTETVTATLANSAGTPLSLVAKTGYAPLKVASKVKVANFNGDLLDGLDSTSFLRSTGTAANSSKLAGKAEASFALATGQFAYVYQGSSVTIDWDGDTVDDARLSVATCPSGTSIVSGGVGQTSASATPAGILASDAEGGNAWYVITAGTTSAPVAQAVCYNPRGTVTGGTPVIP